MIVQVSNRFKKDFALIMKDSAPKVREVITNRLQEFRKCKEVGLPLPRYFRDHPLNNNKRYKDCRDAHLRDDLVVIYKNVGNVVLLLYIGTHSVLFEGMDLCKS